MLGMGHPDPRFCAEFAKELHKSDARILDFGCGTGLVGEELVKAGFDQKNIKPYFSSGEIIVAVRVRSGRSIKW